MKTVTDRFMESIGESGIDGHRFSVLSEFNQAVALLLHMIRHMFGSCIGLRQVCDWAMYVANADQDDLVKNTLPALAHGGILHYAEVATRTCVDVLGLPEEKAQWCQNVTREERRAFAMDIFQGGNMGSADKEGMTNWFTYGRAMGTKQSPIAAFFTKLSVRCYEVCPMAKKHKILLPVLWVFVPVRYMVRSLLGLRPKKSVVKMVQKATTKRKLYEMLNLFQPEEK